MAEDLTEMKSEIAIDSNSENKRSLSDESNQRLPSEDLSNENAKTGRIAKLTKAIDRTVKRCISAAR